MGTVPFITALYKTVGVTSKADIACKLLINTCRARVYKLHYRTAILLLAPLSCVVESLWLGELEALIPAGNTRCNVLVSEGYRAEAELSK